MLKRGHGELQRHFGDSDARLADDRYAAVIDEIDVVDIAVWGNWSSSLDHVENQSPEPSDRDAVGVLVPCLRESEQIELAVVY